MKKCYTETSGALLEYDDRIRKLKGLLAYANATTIVEGFDMTINEALIYLAQLNARVRRYDYLISFQKLTRKTVGIDGKIEYTKILYDQEDAGRKRCMVYQTFRQQEHAFRDPGHSGLCRWGVPGDRS